jgi:tRNA (pseudouridine54-N1)-methyltransferase
MLSNDIRRNVEVFLVLLGEPDPPKTVRLVGEELKYLNPDERSTGALVKSALEKDVGDREIRSTPGIYVCRGGLAEVVNRLKGRRILHLKEEGIDIRDVDISENDVFVLGGQDDLTVEEERLIEREDTVKIALGPKRLHADHCITIVLNELDR